MRERTFTRGDKIVTTQTPAAATQLIAEGWEEVNDWPTERPEPAHRFETEDGQIVGAVAPGPTGPSLTAETGIPTVDQDSRIAARRRKAATETQANAPTE